MVTVGYVDEETIYQFWMDYFLKRELSNVIKSLADEYPENRSLILDYQDIFKAIPDLAEVILDFPEMSFRVGEAGIQSLLEPDQKVAINLRINNLFESEYYNIKDLRARNLSHFLSIGGMITKATYVQDKCLVGVFRCSSCGFEQEIVQDEFSFTEPLECNKEDGGCGKRAGSTTFKFIRPKSLFIDAQKIEVQEPHKSLKTGEHPKRIEVYLEDDLCGDTIPGDNIIINGIKKDKQIKKGQMKSTWFKSYIQGNYYQKDIENRDIIITDKDIDEFNDLFGNNPLETLVNSFVPSIIGREDIKVAHILQLAGGVAVEFPDGNRMRGDIHLLEIGDPGTSKTSLAMGSCHMMPRSQFVEGKTTEAGLTAAAIKDDFGEGAWTIEGGAMVLADGSLVVIDDIHTLKLELLNALLGPLERQKVPVHKADIHAELNSRTSVIALMNPIGGRFKWKDRKRPLIEMIDSKKIPDPFVDRMDFTTGIYDEADPLKDEQMVFHVLKNLRGKVKPEVSFDTSRKFMWYVRNTYKPAIPEDLDSYFTTNYVEKRMLPEFDFKEDNKQLFIRHVFTAIRFAQASAKIRRSNEVNKADVDLAYDLLMKSLINVTSEDGKTVDLNAFDSHMGRSKKEKFERIKDMIYDLYIKEPEDSHYDTTDYDHLREYAAKENIDENELKDYLKKHKDEGNIYEPRPGYYKVLR